MNRIIEAFTKPYFQMTFIDEFIIIAAVVAVIVLIVGVARFGRIMGSLAYDRRIARIEARQREEKYAQELELCKWKRDNLANKTGLSGTRYDQEGNPRP